MLTAASKESKRRYDAGKRVEVQNIGPPPPVADPARRSAAGDGFRVFCDTYFPEAFTLPWSADHHKIIAAVEASVRHGGLFALAMPRGSGKTTIVERAALWATLYGYREFVVVVGASEGAAEEILTSIKTELESNDLLLADFPEVCHAVRELEGQPLRCKGQHIDGERTFLSWKKDRIVYPTVAGSVAAGAILRVAGITGNIRGPKFTRRDGTIVRPSLVIVDDPQTDESAHSPTQRATREATIKGAILGMAGPGKKISGVMPCTVIAPGDLADRILNRDKHPEWNGERTKMVYAWPTNENLWDEYRDIRQTELRNGGRGERATQFLAENYDDMHAGAVLAWPERKNHDELSALQHAMNLRMDRGDAAFFAEYQNDPLPPDESEKQLTSDEIAAKLNGYERGCVPQEVNHLTAFIDVQQAVLFYAVVGWGDNFTGYVIDYGSWPDQRRAYWGLADVCNTLEVATKTTGLEGAIYAALEKLTLGLLVREWRRDDGATMRIERCLVDANWGNSTDVVYQFCRQSQLANVLMPSHGRGIGASSKPLNDYQKKPGDRAGLHWRVPNVAGKRSVRYAIFDSNYWKSFVHRGLAVAMGNRGCLSLFGRSTDAHRMFADHLTAEYSVHTVRKNDTSGREVDEWKLRVGRPDNHWFDCLVGCAVGASMQGCDLINPGNAAGLRKPKARKPLSQMGK